MAVIYTDQAGQDYDYDYGQLASDAPQQQAPLPGWSEVGSQGPGPTMARPNDQVSIQQPTAPAAPNPNSYQLMGGAPIDAGSILRFYDQYLGRVPNAEEVYYASGHPGGAVALEDFIKNSPEAQSRATAGRQKTIGPAATPPPNPTATPYENSSQSLLLNAALQRLSQLQQPIDHSNEDLYAKYALDRVQQLSGAPFTDTQSAALLTKNMEPLTRARDAAKQQAGEELARRGFTPSSGVFLNKMQQIDAAYQKGVAGVTNNLNVQGIDQAQKNAAMQLQILDSLVNMGKMSRQEADLRSQQIVQTAGIPFDTDLRTLQAMTAAAGGQDASSLIASLTGLGKLNLTGTEMNNRNDAANAEMINTVVSYILNHHGSFGF